MSIRHQNNISIDQISRLMIQDVVNHMKFSRIAIA